MASASTIGVLGGGQLGKMLAEAGIPLGLDFVFYDEDLAACAGSVGKIYTDADAFGKAADIYTYEFENASVALAKKLEGEHKLFPSLQALQTAASRMREKSLFKKLNIETTRWFAVQSAQELQEAAKELGFPFVVKQDRLGYDGKGQLRIRNKEELTDAMNTLFTATASDRSQTKQVGYIAEEWIDFKRELSQISVRSRTGDVAHYPPTENVHRAGVLYSSRAPTDISSERSDQLRQWVEAMMRELSYVGVLALEVFDCGDRLVANEFAPRVHNSGHWTIEGAATSQFANHVRAICGLQPGDTKVLGQALMLNLVGTTCAPPQNGHLHIYGKEVRPGRKVGHITFVADSEESLKKMQSEIIFETFMK